MTEPPPASASRGWLQSIASAIIGRLAWLVGAPLLVVGCGFLVMWWSLVQQRDQLGAIQARASQAVTARLVDRYFLVRPTDLDARQSRASCFDTCTIEMDSIAVFEFALPDGRAQRVQFGTWANDWQHNTDFELGLPLLAADFRIDPTFHAKLQAEPAYSDPAKSIWELFWTPAEDAGHWLLRVRDPAPEFNAPLRYDPNDPTTAVLDLPSFARAQSDDSGDLDVQVVALLVFAGIICVMVLAPAVQIMLLGVPRKVTVPITLAICLSVPLWAPHAMKIAPWLSDEAGQLAEGMSREFASHQEPNYLSDPLTDTSALRRLRWELASSPQAAFLAGLDTSLPNGIDPLDHAGAFDALQASFDRQLQAMSPDAIATVLQQLRHHQADTVWELFVPALLRIAADATAPASQRDAALDLLRLFAQDWDLPDVDVFLYRHRLDNYARLRKAPDPDLRATAETRLGEAEARLKQQFGTM
jgi:hypothetical protein